MAHRGFPGGSAVKNLPAMQKTQVQSLGWKNPLEEGMETLQYFCRESHGQRSLAGYSPQGCKKMDTTEATEHA